ncbi:SGNH/GDSL hydrolase family protein [Pedosphaera parvula]|uniref:Lipolytic protein G-D-S-L family n=1 Tax=Pedosphaera parvula (strain Ellin514) TaxID=320771 RepID=B9XIV2_PEDPL|nr:SGNH/GDSL hydrolase family protein [Pedosphaera parvula]EEF60179.1 lipolytic protein G-D-S-L family [Pedosphaera parvula Ellin514]
MSINHLSRRTFVTAALLLSLFSVTGHAQTKTKPEHSETLFEKEIAAFEAADKTNPPPKNVILFVGSSSIRKWTTLTADFPTHKVINRGFGGSHISDSIAFADRIVIPYQPKMIVIYAGGNDINYGKSPEQVFSDFKTFVTKVHEKLPQTKIAFISIATNPSRWSEVEKVKQANQLVETFCKANNLVFIDVFHPMLSPEGKPRPEIYVSDRLHMNEQGYKIWKQVIEPYLD